MKKEKIKNYLKNKDRIKQDLNEKLLALKEDIASSRADFPFDISDFSLSTTSLVIPGREGRRRDVSDAVLRYERAVDQLISQNLDAIHKKACLLEQIAEEIAFCDNVDRMVYCLDQREYAAIKDLTQGLKLHHTAKRLDCSYNTARSVLTRALDDISLGIYKETEKEISNWQ